MSKNDSGLGVGAKIVIGALAVLGAFSVMSFLLGWVLGLIKFALFAAIVVGVVWLIFSARRRD